jgi:hypothetical protein
LGGWRAIDRRGRLLAAIDTATEIRVYNIEKNLL